MSAASSTASTSASASAAASSSIEAQQQSVMPPTPVMTHASRAASQHQHHPLDDFFGYQSISSRTHDSRHDERRQSLADVPPPYAAEAAIPLPEYTLHAPEPVTLAMYLFKFGFLFPPFWFFGAFILLSPLREPPPGVTSDDDLIPAWMPEKTEEERRQIIADIRRVELKWARRCLCAFVVVVLLVTSASIAAWLVMRQRP